MDGVKSTLNRVVSAEFEIPSFLSSGAKDLINCLLKKVENLILFMWTSIKLNVLSLAPSAATEALTNPGPPLHEGAPQTPHPRPP